MADLKLMIIDYYDSLIQQVDIHTEEQLAKYTPNDFMKFESLGNKVFCNHGKTNVVDADEETETETETEEDDDDVEDQKDDEDEDSDDEEEWEVSSDEESDEEENETGEQACRVLLEKSAYSHLDVDSIEDPLRLDEEIVFSSPYEKGDYKYYGKREKEEYIPRSGNVHKFLNKSRDQLIDVLKKAQKEALENYELIKNELKWDKSASEEEDREDLKARLFQNKSLLLFSQNANSYIPNRNSPFKLFLFVIDFYLNKYEREVLRYYKN